VSDVTCESHLSALNLRYERYQGLPGAIELNDVVHGTLDATILFEAFYLGFHLLLVRLELVTVSDHAEDSLGGETDKEFTHALQGKDFLKGHAVVSRFHDDNARIKLLCSALHANFVCNLCQLKVCISNARYVEDLDPTVAGIVKGMSLGLGNNPSQP
jgi:hypothetical protein